MTRKSTRDLSSVSMLELFRAEAENQLGVLTSGLLELERSQSPAQTLESLMRAAHSLKGAARIVELRAVVSIAHKMEDCFVAAQRGRLRLRQAETDLLLQGVDLLSQLAKRSEADLPAWEKDSAPHIERFLASLKALINPNPPSQVQSPESVVAAPPAPEFSSPHPPNPNHPSPGTLPAKSTAEPLIPTFSLRRPEAPERTLRLTAENLNRLLGLAGESLVESRWLRPHVDSLQRAKRTQAEIAMHVAALRLTLEGQAIDDYARNQLSEISRQLTDSRNYLADRIKELETFDRRSAQLSHRLYLEVLRTRMRPFGEGVRRFPRMVRDLARSLGKQVKFEIFGESTTIDRDILESLEAPLAHLMHNAVDHGCETTEQRERAGKPTENVIRLEARHSAGVLLITVTDDGAGVNVEHVRNAIVQKQFATREAAANLTDSELLEYLFRPGFSLREEVTEISGRGVGLDLVQNMVKSVRGTIRVNNQPGRGLRIQLQMPLTLSVLRALLVEVGGEPYALPLGQIVRAMKIQQPEIHTLEGRPIFQLANQHVGLVTARQLLGYPASDLQVSGLRSRVSSSIHPKSNLNLNPDLPFPETPISAPRPQASSCLPEAELSVVVLGERNARFGMVVDAFLGERELVVQPLDKRLGKIKTVSAAAYMEDGSPVLILDSDELLGSVEKLARETTPVEIQNGLRAGAGRRQKRILVVDDSSTVREFQSRLLRELNYLADVVSDGTEAWSALRQHHYDLVITDVDMPRMDGIELTTLIKRDPRLKSVPVLIVSYKDREEDRLRGLHAGADYYLTKGSFHDNLLARAVADLIGETGA